MTGAIDIVGAALPWNEALAGLLLAAFVAGIIRGFAGFGSALLLVPVLALVFDPREAVAMEVIVEIPVTLGLLPIAWRHAERRTIWPMLLMLVLTLPLGATVLKHVDGENMKIAISVVVLVMVGLIVSQGKISGLLGQRALLMTGAAIGVLQGATGMAGPAAATTLLARGDNADTSRANLIAVAAALIFFSAATFWAFGLMTREVVLTGVLLSGPCLLGVYVGTRLFRRYGTQTLRTFVLLLVTATALMTLGNVLLR